MVHPYPNGAYLLGEDPGLVEPATEGGLLGGRSNPLGDLLGDGGTDYLGLGDFVRDLVGLGGFLAGIFSTRRLEIPSPESASELESLEVWNSRRQERHPCPAFLLRHGERSLGLVLDDFLVVVVVDEPQCFFLT